MAIVAVPSGTLIDRVTAVVDAEVLTESELLVEARVVLARQGPDGAAKPVDRAFLVSVREYVVNQILIANQARRVGVVEIPESEVAGALARFEQGFASAAVYRAFLRRFGISEARLQEIIRRDLRNERYLAQRLRSRLGVAEAGRPERMAEEVKKFVEELRQRARIRLLGSNGELEIQ